MEHPRHWLGLLNVEGERVELEFQFFDLLGSWRVNFVEVGV